MRIIAVGQSAVQCFKYVSAGACGAAGTVPAFGVAIETLVAGGIVFTA
jgi:hypothetical protein